MEHERYASWKRIAIDVLRARGRDDAADLERVVWTEEEDLFGFFDCFRPDGGGLERVFAGVVGGDQILPRLLRVYESTKGSEGAYFVVRRPAPVTDERLIELTTQHL